MFARIASPFFIGIFGLVFLLAQIAAVEAQQLRSSSAAAVKNNQPEDDAAFGPADGPDCESSLSENPRARLFGASGRPHSDATRRRKGNRDRSNKGGAALSDDPTPTFQADTASCTRKAAERYRRIADLGGWASISQPIGRNAPAEDVERLRQRLSTEGDLPQNEASGEGWDDALSDAVRNFQRRAGLQQTGEVDDATLKALNVPANVRAHELEASAKRIADVKVDFDGRYVVVNIPSASVEAVQDLRVTQRHSAVAGDVDHQSPSLTAAIRSITINPAWTIPRSIVESEIIPKLKKHPQYLRRVGLVVLDQRRHKINTRRVHWSQAAASFTFRQEPGDKNPLGVLRVDMPNREAVYMHDTPSKQFFAANYRFLSHGCVRVEDIYALAVWLLNANPNNRWDRGTIIEAVRKRDRKRVELAKPIPVVWIYADAWASTDGTVHYRPDVYSLDSREESHQTRQ